MANETPIVSENVEKFDPKKLIENAKVAKPYIVGGVAVIAAIALVKVVKALATPGDFNAVVDSALETVKEN